METINLKVVLKMREIWNDIREQENKVYDSNTISYINERGKLWWDVRDVKNNIYNKARWK